MKVEKTDFVKGATAARGIVVIIDVFRAFSVACYCFDKGVRRIYPVGEIAEAQKLGEKIEGAVLIGERQGKKLPGFDYGNSPTEIQEAELQGKTIIQTTHAGTQGLVAVKQADELLTGALVNARATAAYIRARSPELVTLVRMGFNAEIASDEDNLCADYLESLLLEEDFDVESIRSTLHSSPFSERFFDPAKPWNPPSDFEYCLNVNRFDFAICTEVDEEGRYYLRRQDINF